MGVNNKTPSPSVSSSEAAGGSIKQISIMTFMKKRKEAAIAATKSPPKQSSKHSDIENAEETLSPNRDNASKKENKVTCDNSKPETKQTHTSNDKDNASSSGVKGKQAE